MMNFARNRAFLALLAALLCLTLVLGACGDQTDAPDTGDSAQTTEPEENTEQETDAESTDPEQTTGDDQTSADTEQTTQSDPEPQTMTYTVSVTGSDGTARRGALVIISKGEEQIAQAPTAEDGTASFDLLPDTYQVSIGNILGEGYDTEGCVLTEQAPVLSVQLCGLPAEGEEIYAYNPAADDYIAYMANSIVEGRTMITLNADDMTYYLFVASRGGTFRLSVDADLPVSIGYYGSTSFVLTESVVPEENNEIRIDVYDDMAYNYAFVIGIKAEDAGPEKCILSVEYLSERETTENDVPWTDVMPEEEPVQFTKPQGTLHNFDMEGEVVQLVYNQTDGYYHVGSADGPLVLINLDNNTAYMDALTTVCNNMRLGVYVYDEDGNLLSKDSYNELIWAYSNVSDGGYYALDETLLDMIKTVGDYMGWYDASSPMYLFAGKVLTVENAHLFACVYVQ